MKRIGMAIVMLLLGACGSATPARAPDEVTATWSAGDDAPLEDAAAGDAPEPK